MKGRNLKLNPWKIFEILSHVFFLFFCLYFFLPTLPPRIKLLLIFNFLSIFYKYFHCNCYDELSALVLRLGKFNSTLIMAARFHYFIVEIFKCNRKSYSNSFFFRTFIQFFCGFYIPVNYNFKIKISICLLELCSFYCPFSLKTFFFVFYSEYFRY